MLAERVKAKFPNVVVAIDSTNGDERVVARKEGILSLLKSLRDEPEFSFNMLMDLFAVDYLHWEEKENRFEVIYNLYSLAKNHRLFVKVPVGEQDAVVDSAAAIFPAADWFEREAWDMVGVSFKGHPNLKRILMYDGFEGHALRKDYPCNRRQPIIGPLN